VPIVNIGASLGAPSINVPIGYAPDGTPMGIQFFNEFLGEYELLGFAYDSEQATPWRVAPNLTLLIPEPSTLAILALSGVLLQGRRARKPTPSRRAPRPIPLSSPGK
jgi:hypothetical protein